jgi:hypothetical protein
MAEPRVEVKDEPEVKVAETFTQETVEEKPVEARPVEVKAAPVKREEKKKVSLDEIDKKLDEILDIDLGSV